MVTVGKYTIHGSSGVVKCCYPKNAWTLQWKGLNLYSRGPGPQNSHFGWVRILGVNPY